YSAAAGWHRNRYLGLGRSLPRGSIIYYTRPRGVYCRDWRSEGGHRIFVARYGLALVGDIACSGFACCHSRYPIGKALEPIMNVSGSMASLSRSSAVVWSTQNREWSSPRQRRSTVQPTRPSLASWDFQQR